VEALTSPGQTAPKCMMASNSRAQRVADQLQRDIAELIQFEIDDPRIGLVSVTGVEVSADLAHAKVFVIPLGAGDDAQRSPEQAGRDSAAALNGAAGFLRSLLARRMQLRAAPKLRFHYDASVERGRQLDDLIDRALATDRGRHS